MTIKVNNQKIKFGLKNYLKPTPEVMRRLGNALLSVSTSVTVGGAIAEYKWVTITAAVAGLVGKFLTEFFTEEEN